MHAPSSTADVMVSGLVSYKNRNARVSECGGSQAIESGLGSVKSESEQRNNPS